MLIQVYISLFILDKLVLIAIIKMSMTKREAAKILGVWEEASEKEIKLAYKKQAMRWHPGRV